MSKKKTSKKQASPKENGDEDDQLTDEDLKMFGLLGVGEGDVSLRMLIKGQRRLNGRLLLANQEILAVLADLGSRIDAVAPGASNEGKRRANNSFSGSLARIADHLKYVGGDEPPGCQLPVGGH